MLDDEPLAACGLSGGEDFRDVQISMADLRKLALADCCDGKIFDMQKWQATGKAAACFGRITASRLNPMDVEFGLKMLRRCAAKNLLQHGAAIASEILKSMVVITQRHASAAQYSACGVETGNQAIHLGDIRKIDAGGVGINGMSDAEFSQAIHDLLGILDNHLGRFVAGANLQSRIANDFCRFGRMQTCSPCQLDGRVADLADAFHRSCKVGRCFSEISQRVELNGNLFGFHDGLISSILQPVRGLFWRSAPRGRGCGWGGATTRE